MISTPPRRRYLASFTFACLAAMASAACHAAEGVDLRVYDSPTGERYFAASFAPVAAPSRPTPMDVVIVADTSASQVGPFRKTTLAAVEACLASLHPQDRVELVAADLDARVLTPGPVAPGSPEMTVALDALRGVTPLGASELRGTIESAADRLANRAGDRRQAILYVGDGMSMGETSLAGAWARTASELRRDHVAVSSFAVGPERNPALLASLANYTGGNLYVDQSGMATDDDEASRRGARVGRVLADWAHAEVVWPESASANEAVLAAYPSHMPPLRSDRDTIVLGRLKAGAEQLVVDALAGDETLAWSASVPASHEDNAYLATLVDRASRDDGLSLTTLGSAGLSETARLVNHKLEQLTRVAEQAVAIGDAEGAAKISEAILERDPGNLRAQTVQQSGSEEGLSLIRTAQLEVVEPAEVIAAPADAYPQSDYVDTGAYPPSEVVVDGRFLSAVERNRRVYAQLLEKEVQTTIADARDLMSDDPAAATQKLKLMLQSVERAPELVASIRAGLVDKLQSALREAARQAVAKDSLDRERQQNLAAARERELLLDRLAQDRERMKQLVERFNALVDEGRYAEATEVALITEEVAPDEVISRVTNMWGQQRRYHELNQRLRHARAAMYLETMAQVEESHMPFPDNVPMVYPDAEHWRWLTAAREQYKAVDVAGQSPSEKAISEALTSSLPASGLEFQESPLEEVVDFLREEYEIEIVLDTLALDDLGLGPDEPISVSLRNVSLRSALRRMLKPLELTYVIDDEVLLITTEEEALTKLSVKVYPVADLVIPIPIAQPGGGAGLGGGGLGGGGGGLGGGGLGGGGGGFGGGGQGGGGFGGGGGAFSVPDSGARTLRLTPAEAPAAQAEPASPAATSQPRASTKMHLPAPGADAAEWEAALASDEATPAAVRSATRRLMRQKRYDDTIELLTASMRAGKQQAWMYESLGIAMQLSGADEAEVERAILSAVDLANHADQLVAIADYLAGMGLDRRAVQVYRTALTRAPLLQEVLLPAMAAAKRSGDTDSLRWATTAILERAWPADLQPLVEQAERSSKSLLAELEAEGDARLAERYRAELAEAKRRDCVVKVTWTGDADLDLAVKEPNGAVCWAGAERTSGGGLRVESASDNPEATVHTETYVCPKGFAGGYEALVTKVWGDVVADAVTIEITIASGTEAEQTQKQQVELDENGHAMAKFDAPVGRRDEAIAESALAEALRRQDTVNRSVVAQRISSMATEEAVSLRPENQRQRRRALAGQGAVGFQPIITVLPEGTNLSATAVVSADRRYVRVTPTPIFSVIGDVAQFSFSGAGTDPFANLAAQAGAQANPAAFQVGNGGVGGNGGGNAGGNLGGGGGGFGGNQGGGGGNAF